MCANTNRIFETDKRIQNIHLRRQESSHAIRHQKILTKHYVSNYDIKEYTN